MNKQLLIHERAVPVSRDTHRTATVRRGMGFGFARDLNAVPVVVGEFEKAAGHYPIVFAEAGNDVVSPVAILGLRDRENLFVSDTGTWDGSYVPAFLRRYPFVLARPSQAGSFVVCIDEIALEDNGDGPRLFDDSGNDTALLKEALDFLKKYHQQTMTSLRFCRMLAELDLLQPMKARYLVAGEEKTLGGFQTVDRKRLEAVDRTRLEELFSQHFLEYAFLHLFSLQSISQLSGRLTGRQ